MHARKRKKNNRKNPTAPSTQQMTVQNGTHSAGLTINDEKKILIEFTEEIFSVNPLFHSKQYDEFHVDAIRILNKYAGYTYTFNGVENIKALLYNLMELSNKVLSLSNESKISISTPIPLLYDYLDLITGENKAVKKIYYEYLKTDKKYFGLENLSDYNNFADKLFISLVSSLEGNIVKKGHDPIHIHKKIIFIHIFLLCILLDYDINQAEAAWHLFCKTQTFNKVDFEYVGQIFTFMITQFFKPYFDSKKYKEVLYTYEKTKGVIQLFDLYTKERYQKCLVNFNKQLELYKKLSENGLKNQTAEECKIAYTIFQDALIEANKSKNLAKIIHLIKEYLKYYESAIDQLTGKNDPESNFLCQIKHRLYGVLIETLYLSDQIKNKNEIATLADKIHQLPLKNSVAYYIRAIAYEITFLMQYQTWNEMNLDELKKNKEILRSSIKNWLSVKNNSIFRQLAEFKLIRSIRYYLACERFLADANSPLHLIDSGLFCKRFDAYNEVKEKTTSSFTLLNVEENQQTHHQRVIKETDNEASIIASLFSLNLIHYDDANIDMIIKKIQEILKPLFKEPASDYQSILIKIANALDYTYKKNMEITFNVGPIDECINKYSFDRDKNNLGILCEKIKKNMNPADGLPDGLMAKLYFKRAEINYYLKKFETDNTNAEYYKNVIYSAIRNAIKYNPLFLYHMELNKFLSSVQGNILEINLDYRQLVNTLQSELKNIDPSQHSLIHVCKYNFFVNLLNITYQVFFPNYIPAIDYDPKKSLENNLLKYISAYFEHILTKKSYQFSFYTINLIKELFNTEHFISMKPLLQDKIDEFQLNILQYLTGIPEVKYSYLTNDILLYYSSNFIEIYHNSQIKMKDGLRRAYSTLIIFTNDKTLKEKYTFEALQYFPEEPFFIMRVIPYFYSLAPKLKERCLSIQPILLSNTQLIWDTQANQYYIEFPSIQNHYKNIFSDSYESLKKAFMNIQECIAKFNELLNSLSFYNTEYIIQNNDQLDSLDNDQLLLIFTPYNKLIHVSEIEFDNHIENIKSMNKQLIDYINFFENEFEQFNAIKKKHHESLKEQSIRNNFSQLLNLESAIIHQRLAEKRQLNAVQAKESSYAIIQSAIQEREVYKNIALLSQQEITLTNELDQIYEIDHQIAIQSLLQGKGNQPTLDDVKLLYDIQRMCEQNDVNFELKGSWITRLALLYFNHDPIIAQSFLIDDIDFVISCPTPVKISLMAHLLTKHFQFSSVNQQIDLFWNLTKKTTSITLDVNLVNATTPTTNLTIFHWCRAKFVTLSLDQCREAKRLKKPIIKLGPYYLELMTGDKYELIKKACQFTEIMIAKPEDHMNAFCYNIYKLLAKLYFLDPSYAFDETIQNDISMSLNPELIKKVLINFFADRFKKDELGVNNYYEMIEFFKKGIFEGTEHLAQPFFEAFFEALLQHIANLTTTQMDSLSLSTQSTVAAKYFIDIIKTKASPILQKETLANAIYGIGYAIFCNFPLIHPQHSPFFIQPQLENQANASLHRRTF